MAYVPLLCFFRNEASDALGRASRLSAFCPVSRGPLGKASLASHIHRIPNFLHEPYVPLTGHVVLTAFEAVCVCIFSANFKSNFCVLLGLFYHSGHLPGKC